MARRRAAPPAGEPVPPPTLVAHLGGGGAIEVDATLGIAVVAVPPLAEAAVRGLIAQLADESLRMTEQRAVGGRLVRVLLVDGREARFLAVERIEDVLGPVGGVLRIERGVALLDRRDGAPPSEITPQFVSVRRVPFPLRPRGQSPPAPR